MFNKFRITLWDLVTFFATGVLLILMVFQYTSETVIRDITKLNIFQGEISVGIYFLLITYTLGVTYEPIAIVSFTLFGKLYRRLPFYPSLKRMKKERDELYYPKIRAMLKEELGFQNAKADYFQFAKIEVLQSSRPNNYEMFLSRFGFYRNLTSLAFMNVPLLFLLKYSELSLLALIGWSGLLLFLHLLLFYRARQFYYYAGNEVFRNFLMGRLSQKHTQSHS